MMRYWGDLDNLNKSQSGNMFSWNNNPVFLIQYLVHLAFELLFLLLLILVILWIWEKVKKERKK